MIPIYPDPNKAKSFEIVLKNYYEPIFLNKTRAEDEIEINEEEEESDDLTNSNQNSFVSPPPSSSSLPPISSSFLPPTSSFIPPLSSPLLLPSYLLPPSTSLPSYPSDPSSSESLFKEMNRFFAKSVMRLLSSQLRFQNIEKFFYVLDYHLCKVPYFLRKTLVKQQNSIVPQIRLGIALGSFPDESRLFQLMHGSKLISSILAADVVSFGDWEDGLRFFEGCEGRLGLVRKSHAGGFLYLEVLGRVVLVGVAKAVGGGEEQGKEEGGRGEEERIEEGGGKMEEEERREEEDGWRNEDGRREEEGRGGVTIEEEVSRVEEVVRIEEESREEGEDEERRKDDEKNKANYFVILSCELLERMDLTKIKLNLFIAWIKRNLVNFSISLTSLYFI